MRLTAAILKRGKMASVFAPKRQNSPVYRGTEITRPKALRFTQSHDIRRKIFKPWQAFRAFAQPW